MDYSKEFLDFLNSITAKRARTVIQHIIEHGFITSEELKATYGYDHPPRAVRDVREHGVPIVTSRITGNSGRSIAAYKFGNPNKTSNNLSKASGRTVHAKALKQVLIDKYGSKCFVYFEDMNEAILQVDHRVPYEIDGEQDKQNIDVFMLLSPSANRAKSQTCEHCENWIKKDKSFCIRCFWAHPENYDHIAGRDEKMISIVFTENEIEDYNKLINLTGEESAQDLIKRIIHEHLRKI
ncbi:MAG: helix-turn-helix domain-containing protein [Candidatus Adiutrix sp.]